MAQLYTLPTQRYAGAFLIELDPTLDWTGVSGVILASDNSAWLDYTRLPVSGGTENRVLSREIADGADFPVRTLRALLHMNTAAGSISSGAVDSPFNQLPGSFSPAIFGGRRIIVQDPLGSPTSTNPADWKPRFWGYLDDPTASSSGDVTLFARDAASRLMIPYTGDPVWIGTEGNLVPLDEALQLILDAAMGEETWPLKSPGGDLEWGIPAFQLGRVDNVLQTIRDAAQQRGAVVRWWPDSGTGRFQLSLFVLQVDKGSPDFTYTPGQTEDIPAHGSDITSYRNDFKLEYFDSGTERVEEIHRAATEAEKAAFGLQPLVITEGSTSHINTAAEAGVMLDSVEGALRIPATVGTRRIPRNNAIEVNTLLRFTADGRVTQEAVDLYVVNWTERVAMSGTKAEAWTRVDLRGAPVGQIGAWLRSFARVASQPVVASLAAELAELQAELEDFEATITGAFRDEIISEAEAKAIAEHTKQLNKEKADVDLHYTTIHGHAELTGTPKTNLASAKTAYNTAHATLLSAISSAIADGQISPAERTSVTNAFSAYGTALATLTQRFDQAVDAIKNAGLAAISADLVDVYNELLDLGDYVDGAFEDAVVSQAEAKAIAEHVRTLTTEKADLDLHYTTVHGNAALTGTAKTNLASAKVTYNSTHTDLVNAINAAIADGLITPAERAAVSSGFASYRGALATLTQRFDQAVDAIKNAGITALQTYIDGAFSDGVISEAEALAIGEHVRQLTSDKADLDQEYTTVHENVDLVGTPKTNLASAKSPYNTAHTNLLNAIATAIADSLITPTERTNVTNGFTSYRSALVTLRLRLQEAIDAIKNRGVATAYQPRVQVVATRSGATVTITLTATDPLLRATAVEFAKREGTGGDTGFVSTWDSSTGAAGSSTSLTRAEAVTVSPGHDSEFRWRLTWTDEAGVSRTKGDTVPLANLLGLDDRPIHVSFKAFSPSDGYADSSFQTNTDGGFPSNFGPASNGLKRCSAGVVLPEGVVLRRVYVHAYVASGSETVGFRTFEIPFNSSPVLVHSFTTNATTGWQKIDSGGLAKTIAANTQYIVEVYLTEVSARNTAVFREAEFRYDRDAFDKIY